MDKIIAWLNKSWFVRGQFSRTIFHFFFFFLWTHRLNISSRFNPHLRNVNAAQFLTGWRPHFGPHDFVVHAAAWQHEETYSAWCWRAAVCCVFTEAQQHRLRVGRDKVCLWSPTQETAVARFSVCLLGCWAGSRRIRNELPSTPAELRLSITDELITAVVGKHNVTWRVIARLTCFLPIDPLTLSPGLLWSVLMDPVRRFEPGIRRSFK